MSKNVAVHNFYCWIMSKTSKNVAVHSGGGPLKEHEKSAMHKRAGEVIEHEKAEEQGTSVKRRIVQEVPEDAPINRGLKVMQSEEQKIVSKLHDVAYYKYEI